MTTLRQAAQAALEALESVLCDPEGKAGIRGSDADNAIIDAALDALRAALAEPQPQPEPVATEFHNPWRASLENCISGDNYLRSREYHELIEELDDLYRMRLAAPQTQQPQPEPVVSANIRTQFERFFAESRKCKGPSRRPTFAQSQDGTYVEDSTQRHWWTWQNAASQTARKPMTDDQIRELVEECGLPWRQGFVPLYPGDTTNRYAVLVREVEGMYNSEAP